MLRTTLLASLLVGITAEDVTITLNKGKLKGERMDYDFGQYYYAFKGVPYAKPPVKELRFQVISSIMITSISLSVVNFIQKLTILGYMLKQVAKFKPLVEISKINFSSEAGFIIQ